MDATERFTDRVESYRLHRPRYPIEIVDRLQRECNLQPDASVVDIAAGTGLLAEIFLAHGHATVAIEPNREMRQTCATLTARFPVLECREGTAENTGLPSQSADLITVGQALHWFDLPSARAEFVRILRPGGWCAVVYNERHMGGDPFHEGYEEILQEFGIDYEMVRHRYLQEERLAGFFGHGNMRQSTFLNEQRLDREALTGRILSSSYMPQPDHPRYPTMLGEIETLFARCAEDGHVRMEYDCIVSYGQLE